ncbi:MAG TPA: TraR/DksA C4-type zinc finger protein [Rubrobacteraceae bacterium]|nr:TraR/DksA C4-type zinc finger protein [Rubrobacteraceae bacterium]
MADNQLDKEFVEKQRTRLEELRTELVRMVEGLEEDQRYRGQEEEDFTEHDSGDRSHSLFTRELDAGVEQTVERRLQNVERALQKVEEGTYGICDATGEPIPKGRLEAVPEALYTIDAQRRQENLRGRRRSI